jgi:hypothetical protein
MQRVVNWWCTGHGGGTLELQLAIGYAIRTLDGHPPLADRKLANACERKLVEIYALMERQAIR